MLIIKKTGNLNKGEMIKREPNGKSVTEKYSIWNKIQWTELIIKWQQRKEKNKLQNRKSIQCEDHREKEKNKNPSGTFI